LTNKNIKGFLSHVNRLVVILIVGRMDVDFTTSRARSGISSASHAIGGKIHGNVKSCIRDFNKGSPYNVDI